MRKLMFLAVAAVCGAALAEGDEGLVEQKSCNAWHLRIGPVMSPRVRIYSSASPAPKASPAPALSTTLTM